jgi:hypothetical protein
MANGIPRVFTCERCKDEYNENESPSDFFCGQVCQDVWIRVQSKKLDAAFDVRSPGEVAIMGPFGWHAYVRFRSESDG